MSQAPQSQTTVAALVLFFGALVVAAQAWDVSQHTQLEELYLVGGSCDAGWSTQRALPFARPDPSRHLFSITARLKTDGYGVKMIRSQSSWQSDIGMLALSWYPYGPLGHGAQGKLEQDNEQNIPPPAVEAIYNFTVDMEAGTWWYICVDLCDAIAEALPPRTDPLLNVSLLYSGKLRGRLLPYSKSTGITCTKQAAVLPDCVGGLPNIAAYARKLRGEGKNVVLLDAGEFFFGADSLSPEAAAELTRLAGYSFLNANARDFQAGPAVIKDFARALGPNISLVLSNGNSPMLSEVDPSLSRPFVVGFGALEVSPGFKVGVLGFLDEEAKWFVDDLKVNDVRSDCIATMNLKLQQMKREHNPQLVVVLNSLNHDMEAPDIANYLLGSDVILGGTGTSLSPLSLTSFGPVLNYGWQTAYGGEELQQLDLTLNAHGDIVDSRYTSTRMDGSGATLPLDDPMLSRTYELVATKSSLTNPEPLGQASVDFFFEGDPSKMRFSREQAPAMYLLTHMLYEACPLCTAVFLHPSLVDAGLQAGPITLNELSRMFPLTGDETIIDVIEVNGAQLIEGVKELFWEVEQASLTKGLLLSLLTTQGINPPLTGIQVALREGGRANVNRTRMYRVGLPRWHRIRKLPRYWVTMPVVQELGQMAHLFANFIRQRSPLKEGLLGPLGVLRSTQNFKRQLNQVCQSNKPRQELWDLGCVLAVGAHDDVEEMLAPCEAGETLQCLGRFPDSTCGDFQCVTCDPGSVRTGKAATKNHFWSYQFSDTVFTDQPFVCTWCAPGTYRDAGMSATQCALCPVDTFAQATGSITCAPCPNNSHQEDRGQTVCRCDVSFYKDPQDNVTSGSSLPCLPCSEVLAGSTTRFPGARGNELCQCPEGTFAIGDGGAGVCHPCPEGMTCPFGRTMVPQAGRMTLPSHPLEVYTCFPAAICPGGALAQCAPYHDSESVACGRCRYGAHMGHGGVCKPCGDSGATEVVVFVVLLTCALCALSIFANRDFLLQPASKQEAVSLLGIGAFAVQVFGTFDDLRFTEVQPLASIVRASKGVNLDVKFLKLECMSHVGPAGTFIVSLGIPFASIACLVGVLAVKKLVRRGINFKVECANSIGTVCQVIFIALVFNCIRPLNCYAHPGGKRASMRSHPSVLCFESRDHETMLAVGVASFAVVPLPFMAANVAAIFKFRKFIAHDSGLDFLRATKFWFVRFKPSVYYYSSVMIVRSLCLCLVPIIIQDKPALQFIAVIGLLGMAMIIQQTLQPFASNVMNVVDGVLSVMLILIVSSGSSQDFTLAANDMGIVCNIIAAITTAVVFIPAVAAMVRTQQRRIEYGNFVCHHKVDAAAQSRLLKMLLDKVSHKPTFIDSDHLQDLSVLFGIVKFKTGRVIVYLTTMTLTRPWCVGEITSAEACKVPMFGVVTSSWAHPSAAEMDHMVDRVDLTSFKAVVYGLSLDRMCKALCWFCSSAVDKLEVNMEHTVDLRCKAIVDYAAKQKTCDTTAKWLSWASCSPQLRITLATTLPAPRRMVQASSGLLPKRSTGSCAKTPVGTVLLSADPSDDEAVAGAHIVLMTIAVQMFLSDGARLQVLSEDDCTDSGLQDIMGRAYGLIVILSAKTLRCLAQLRTISEGMVAREHGKLAVVPAATPSFRFLTEEGLNQVLPPAFTFSAHKKLQVINLFKLIACPLGLHDSGIVLSTHCEAIRTRMMSFTRTMGTLSVSSRQNPVEDHADDSATSALPSPSAIEANMDDGTFST